MSDKGSDKQQKGEFHILPIDEDKKNPPPHKGRHSHSGNGPDLRSEFHVGPALMPGIFMGSMGANATAFERENAAKKREKTSARSTICIWESGTELKLEEPLEFSEHYSMLKGDARDAVIMIICFFGHSHVSSFPTLQQTNHTMASSTSTATVPTTGNLSLSTTSKRTPLPFAFQFLAASMAGMTEIVSMYPLDLVKTRLQLQITTPPSPIKTPIIEAHGIMANNSTPKATPPRPYSSIVNTLHRVVRREGVLQLYRGVLPPLIAEAPKRAIKFGAYEQWGFILKKIFSLDRLTALQAGFVGSMAGATEAIFVTPFELVKVRLQDRASLKLYSGTADCIRKIAAQEGILTFYRGLEATIWRHASWSGIYFMTIQGFRIAFPERSTASREENLMRNFIAGTIGGILGTLIDTPFDVVKSRIQNQHSGSVSYVLPRVGQLYRQEGFRALYKGLAPKLIRVGAGGGLLLVVFDTVSEVMRMFVVDNQPGSASSTS
ncbi:hypothetical protein FBU30_010904 [Linnemannia zychae]|nr:hypothetical protein FBU30_010904 [Linnemannia zychae]